MKEHDVFSFISVKNPDTFRKDCKREGVTLLNSPLWIEPTIIVIKKDDKKIREIQSIWRILERLVRLVLSGKIELSSFGFSKKHIQLIKIESSLDYLLPFGRCDAMGFGSDLRLMEANSDGTSGYYYQDTINSIAKQNCAKPFRIPTSLCPKVLDNLIGYYKKVRKNSNKKPAIAIVDTKGISTTPEFIGLSKIFKGFGINTYVLDPRELKLRHGNLTAPDGSSIDIIYRRFLAIDILPFVNEVNDMLKAVKNGNVCMAGPFASEIVFSKISFAMLHNSQFLNYCNKTERKLLEKWIPHTSILKPPFLWKDVEVKNIRKFLNNNRESLVLKPAMSYGGKGVFIGNLNSKDNWNGIVQYALKNGYVVQERIEQKYLNINGKKRYLQMGYFFIGGIFAGYFPRLSRSTFLSPSSTEWFLPVAYK